MPSSLQLLCVTRTGSVGSGRYEVFQPNPSTIKRGWGEGDLMIPSPNSKGPPPGEKLNQISHGTSFVWGYASVYGTGFYFPIPGRGCVGATPYPRTRG